MYRRRPTTLFVTAIAIATCLALGAQAIAAGGLTSTPAFVEHVAAVGKVGTTTVSNTTSKALNITVTPRPWIQSRNASVTTNRKRTLLSQVSVSARTFTLQPNTTRSVDITLLKMTSSKALYGNIEVVGLPPAAKSTKNGIVAGYSLVSSLRLTPAAADRRLRLQIGGARVKTSGSAKARRKSAWVGIRNNGNTVDPVSGKVSIKGPTGTVSHSLPSRRILPGAIVDYKLGTLKKAGKYTATLTLVQGTKHYKAIVRSFNR